MAKSESEDELMRLGFIKISSKPDEKAKKKSFSITTGVSGSITIAIDEEGFSWMSSEDSLGNYTDISHLGFENLSKESWHK